MNVHGGSVAIGHPFAATGARIVATLAHILEKAGSGRGLISICTAGGMGVAAIIERSSDNDASPRTAKKKVRKKAAKKPSVSKADRKSTRLNSRHVAIAYAVF